LPALYRSLNEVEDACLEPLRNRLETLLEGLPNKEEEKEKEKEKEEETEEEGKNGIAGSRNSLSPVGDQPQKSRKSRMNVPYQKIADLYNDLCPGLQKVVTMGDDRKKALSARWHTSPEFQTLSFWEGFWRRVWLADWLCGRIEGKDGRSFMADFDWCIRPRNFVRIIEGKYDPKPGKGKAARNRMDVLAGKDPREILAETFKPGSLRDEAGFEVVEAGGQEL
jgi:hypothetical protein